MAHAAQASQPAPRKIDGIHALWWGLFAVGGMVAATLVPVHILVQGVLGPLGLVASVNLHYDTYLAVASNPLVRLYLFVLISLPFFHAAHRLRFLLLDLGLRGGQRALAAALYGGAVLGSLITAYVLVTL